MPATHAQRKALGDFGERLAAQQLVDAGMVLLDRNWRCPVGEIDIVAAQGPTLVVCEVKTRSSTRYGTPLEAITAEKAARLHKLGRMWARAHLHPFSTIRVDVITVARSRRGSAVLEHVVGVC